MLHLDTLKHFQLNCSTSWIEAADYRSLFLTFRLISSRPLAWKAYMESKLLMADDSGN